MTAARKITASDILPLDQYSRLRAERRSAMSALKRNRRIELGTVVTFYFECYETMLHQVQEMLFIEKGGAEQLPDELAAYNPLIPNGQELTATVMIEIDDELRRKRVLAELGGVEFEFFLRVSGEVIKGQPEDDQERTNEAGKTSSVHFLHFPFSKGQIEAFRKPGAEIVIGCSHPKYQHMAIIPEAVREGLSADFA
ncbi:MAG: hypothetical protein K0S54_881 [Alphaproteobacteria bacterium]|nr:hypothetical protein [Alphaproteobacteria bacterium]